MRRAQRPGTQMTDAKDSQPSGLASMEGLGLGPKRGTLPYVPPLPFAVFDEFGRGADDRVHAYAIVHAAAAVAAERERCAKVCEEVETQAWALWKTTADPTEQGRSIGAQHCADAIRA